MIGRKRERDSDDEETSGLGSRQPSQSAGLMTSTDAVLEGELDKLRAKSKFNTVAVPRWCYASLATQLKDKATFLLALRTFHDQAGGAGKTMMSGISHDSLMRTVGYPPLNLHCMFLAVAAAGGTGQLQGDPDWRRIGLVPGVIAASRAALADLSGLPALVRKTFQLMLSPFELVFASRISRNAALAPEVAAAAVVESKLPEAAMENAENGLTETPAVAP